MKRAMRVALGFAYVAFCLLAAWGLHEIHPGLLKIVGGLGMAWICLDLHDKVQP